jgi:hypothetical protein
MGKRKEAKLAGETFYMSDKPCLRGHHVKRRVDNGICSQCAYEASIVYREKHHDKILKKRAAKRIEDGIKPRKKYVPKPRKKKEPKIEIYKEARITEEEQKAETFDEMVKRLYKEDRRW